MKCNELEQFLQPMQSYQQSQKVFYLNLKKNENVMIGQTSVV